MRTILRRGQLGLLAAASTALIAAGLPPSPQAAGIGDPLFPDLGNPGYDVRSYDISLTYSGDNTSPVDTVTRIDATTTSRLDTINLDYAHGTVHWVKVNGRRVPFASVGEDLVLTLAHRVRAGRHLRITISHSNDPTGNSMTGGWIPNPDGLELLNEPDAAHRVIPSNDHPSDKAYFTYRITAPAGVTAVANGVLISHTRHGATTTSVYRGEHPMATDLMQISLGDSKILHRQGPHGLPMRDVVPSSDVAALEPWLEKTPGQISWMEKQLGVAFPFETYGLLITGTHIGAELETQTLPIFEENLFTRTDLPAWYVQSLMVHELSHQWFGDSVSPDRWADVWLNEGHATWYETVYGEQQGGPALDDRMLAAYQNSDTVRAADGPPAAPKAPTPGVGLSLFRPGIYDGGALVLYALREEIGDHAFQRVEHDWVLKHRDGSATTADFVRLASHVAGRDLSGFLDAWLYSPTTPPMPGHPDWHTTPAT
ncbi:M1 family metallopeptidase [Streptomyces sp. NPDC003393]